jgi:hypothetical protein
MEEKEKLVKDSFYVKLNQIYEIIPAYNTNITQGNFNTKTGREEILKPVIGNWSLHETSNDNGIRATDFATNNTMIIKNIQKETCKSPDRKTNNQIDHVLVDGK